MIQQTKNMLETLTGIDLKEKLLADYSLQKSALLLDNPMIASFRENAANAFRKQGFPSKKHEEYRYIAMDKFLRKDYNHPLTAPSPSIVQLPESILIDSEAHRLVMVNGFFAPALSNVPEGIQGFTAGSLADAIRNKNVTALTHIGTLSNPEADPFLALNSAMFADGIFIHLAKNVVIEKSIQIIQLTTSDEPIFVLPRVLVVAEDGAQLTLIGITPESPEKQDIFINTVTEVHCGKNANVHLVQVYDSKEISVIHHTEAHVHTHGNFSHYAIHLNGRLVRNNLNIVLADAHCEAHLYGYYHPTGEQIFDSHTLVDHRMPNCESNELYKGVIDDNGTAIFNGKVYVRQDAQKTNAYQSNKNILLNEDATVNTKPQLEIYADDVKCSHGSSTGVLDPEQMFYLRSRGISTPKARALLLNAYAGEILEKLPSEKLRNTLTELLQEKYSA